MKRDAGGADFIGSSLSAVIFDVDGVLVQSMERHYESYQKAFDSIGLKIRRESVFDHEGRGSRDIIRQILGESDVCVSPAEEEALNAAKQRAFASFGPMPMYPGAREMIEAFHDEGLKLALVTGTVRRNVEAHFPDLVARFDSIVTADDVTRTKPDPEPYLKAVQKIALPPERCVVVENAPLGIRAAKAAELRVVAITSTLPADRLRQADWIVRDVFEARRVVEGLR